ncbi:MAG: hypothetical protein GXP08_17355 [Gammaproteobacteria bacterium]|nr:hypothetical protein [Gammaproteobacteria bacterium]
MMEQQKIPNVGEWYQSIYSDPFRVVAIDEDAQTVDVQFIDGDVDELEFESLSELHLKSIGPPEGWSGPFDDLESDGLDYTDFAQQPADIDVFLMEVDRQDE